MGKQDFYLSLTKSYSNAHPHLSKAVIQKNVNDIWAQNKKSSDLQNKISKLIAEYDQLARKREAKIRQFWVTASKKSIPDKTCEEEVLQIETTQTETTQTETNIIHQANSSSSTNDDALPIGSINPNMDAIYKKPAQEMLQKKIDLINADMCGLYQRRNLDMLSDEQSNDLSAKETEKKKLQSKLNRRIQDQSRQKRRRVIAKDKMAKLMASVNSDNENFIKMRSSSGRPRLECDQPLLLKAICDIAIHGSGAHERRRCDILRSVKTLDDLLIEIQKQGFQISRSGLYLRMLPRNHLTTEGKRHINTVPVKLIGAQNDKHESHIDGAFCTSTIRNLEELASFLGPNEVFFLSQDDKAKVAIGVTAAKKQAPILMHLEYKVTLPDHDFVVASKHKLTPSVYAGIVIKPDGLGKAESVTYSGPTYIAIRSGKFLNISFLTLSVI